MMMMMMMIVRCIIKCNPECSTFQKRWWYRK